MLSLLGGDHSWFSLLRCVVPRPGPPLISGLDQVQSEDPHLPCRKVPEAVLSFILGLMERQTPATICAGILSHHRSSSSSGGRTLTGTLHHGEHLSSCPFRHSAFSSIKEVRAVIWASAITYSASSKVRVYLAASCLALSRISSLPRPLS